MRLYVAGPMRGIPGSNLEEFRLVANLLRQQGHDVLDPSMSQNMFGIDHRHFLMRYDIQLLLCVDGIVVIDGWEESPGAQFEVAMAWQIGIPVYSLLDKPGGATLELREINRHSVVIPSEHQCSQSVPLIGLSGYAGAGKDEFAKILVGRGWHRVAFADALKEFAAAIGWDGNKDDVGRKLLQDIGLAARQYINPDIWVTIIEESIDSFSPTPCVITDVRFPNEMKMVKRRGGTIIRIVREGVGPANDHISEHSIQDNHEGVDFIFENNCSLEDLSSKVKKFLYL